MLSRLLPPYCPDGFKYDSIRRVHDDPQGKYPETKVCRNEHPNDAEMKFLSKDVKDDFRGADKEEQWKKAAMAYQVTLNDDGTVGRICDPIMDEKLYSKEEWQHIKDDHPCYTEYGTSTEKPDELKHELDELKEQEKSGSWWKFWGGDDKKDDAKKAEPVAQASAQMGKKKSSKSKPKQHGGPNNKKSHKGHKGHKAYKGKKRSMRK
jgi:hypothetical protein